MPPSMKTCPECGEELYALHYPRHMYGKHGIGDPPKTRGPKHARTDATKPAPEGRAHATNPTPARNDPAPDAADPPAVEPDEVIPRKPGMLERFRSRRGRGQGGQTSSAPATRERPPRRPRGSGKRVALDSDISDVWAFAGRRLENSPHFATGRMLQYQAPAAGVILDRAIAGTLPDRLLFQRIAQNRDKYEDVGFLLAGPLLTFSITSTGQQMQQALDDDDRERFEELARKLDMQREMFTWVARAMLPRLAEGKRKAEEKKAKDDAAIAEAFPELQVGDDPVEVLATMLFTPPQWEAHNGNGQHETADPAPAPDREGAVPFGD